MQLTAFDTKRMIQSSAIIRLRFSLKHKEWKIERRRDFVHVKSVTILVHVIPTWLKWRLRGGGICNIGILSQARSLVLLTTTLSSAVLSRPLTRLAVSRRNDIESLLLGKFCASSCHLRIWISGNLDNTERAMKSEYLSICCNYIYFHSNIEHIQKWPKYSIFSIC